MEAALSILSVLYAAVAAVAIAFILWVSPIVAVTCGEFMWQFVKPEWNRATRNLHELILELKEHHQWLEWEQGRHRVKNVEHEFSTWILENIEIQEGRRTPVSIRG